MSLPLWEECAWYVEVPEIEEEELKYEDFDKEYVEYDEEVDEPMEEQGDARLYEDPLTGLLHSDGDISFDICNEDASVINENEQLLKDASIAESMNEISQQLDATTVEGEYQDDEPEEEKEDADEHQVEEQEQRIDEQVKHIDEQVLDEQQQTANEQEQNADDQVVAEEEEEEEEEGEPEEEHAPLDGVDTENDVTTEHDAENGVTLTPEHEDADNNSQEHEINEELQNEIGTNETLEDIPHESEEQEGENLSDEEHETEIENETEEDMVEHENNVEDEVCTENDEFETVDISVDILESPEESVPEASKYKFPIDKSINKRMYLYLGAIYKIPCDAIVIGQVESLLDRHDGNDVIFTLAGIELEPQLAALAPCQTGDSVITTGGQMPCEYIIHSVGPKYDEKYLNASDHALFSAYKTALLLAAEKEVSSLIIGTIYKQTKNYPRFDAAHVALRTVRKFLEHTIGNIFQRIMFCVTSQEDFEIYSALMHAYFPRTEEDLEDQINLLPIELGDEWGEVKIPDRVVKLSVGPKPLPKESLEQYKHHSSSRGELVCSSDECKETGSDAGAHSPAGPKKLGTGLIKAIGEGPPRSMTQADQDPDYARQKKVRADFAKMSREERLSYRFQAMLREIEEEEDLDELDALQLVSFLGKDFKERTVVYLSGANLLRAETMDRHRVLLYLLKRMEAVRCVPFVLIYGCATLGDASYPDTEFMQSVFDLFGCRYNDTLMKFYIMHASFSFRMYFWLLLPMETTMYWSSYTNLTSIRSMRHYMDISSLELPADLLRYDREHYPDPEA